MVERDEPNTSAMSRKRRADIFGYVTAGVILALILGALAYVIRTLFVLFVAAAA